MIKYLLQLSICCAYVRRTSGSLMLPICMAQDEKAERCCAGGSGCCPPAAMRAANACWRSALPVSARTGRPAAANVFAAVGSFRPSHRAALLAVIASTRAANHASVPWGIVHLGCAGVAARVVHGAGLHSGCAAQALNAPTNQILGSAGGLLLLQPHDWTGVLLEQARLTPPRALPWPDCVGWQHPAYDIPDFHAWFLQR